MAGIALVASLATMLTIPWPVAWAAGWKAWLVALGVVALIESVVFWIGIVTVYLTSVQLGLKIHVIGILCGWIPIVNLIALRLIIRTAAADSRTIC